MTHDPERPMTCHDAETLISDHLDGTLSDADRERLDAHCAQCASCAAILGDLQAIRQSAATLPPLRPARDLWADVERRIAAPVVVLDERRRVPAWARRAPWRQLAAAVVLMAATAGVTYTVATRSGGTDATVAAAGPAAPDSAPVSAPVATGLPADGGGRATVAAAPPSAASGAQRSSTRTVAATAAPAAEATYDREIAQMRRLLDARSGSLDDSTVAVLRRNLGIIDAAIRESRAALARDPASRLLNEQLTDALDQKLALMRTAVILTSRT